MKQGVLLQAVVRHTFYRLPIVVFNEIRKRDFTDYRKYSVRSSAVFEDMKEVSDRALKLAETSKKSSLGNWELGGIIGLAAFIAGVLLAK